MTPDAPTRFPKNAPGPFYTTGECMVCGAPEVEAPDQLAGLSDDNYDTYFVRQPSTPEEVERACRAVEVCCVDALRYGGRDPAIIRRLANDPRCCDHPLPGSPVPRLERLQPSVENDEPRMEPKRTWWRFWRWKP